jgi:hypothetical protein
MDEKLADLISKDGHNLESKVRKLLEEYEWKVYPNESYLDIASKKDRKTDIIAEKKYNRTFHGGWHLGVRLVIECKWRQGKLMNDVAINTEKRNNMEILKIISDQYRLGKETSRGHDLSSHHYLNEDIHFTNHCTPDSGYLYDGLEQAVHAFHHFQLNTMADVGHPLQFPVVITDGPGKVFIRETGELYEENFQYSYPYTVENKRTPHIVDVIPFEKIIYFLGLIENDVQVLKGINDFKRMMVSQRRSPDPRNSAR